MLVTKSEAFPSVHHVTFILCYNVLSDLFGLRFATFVFALIRARKHWRDNIMSMYSYGAKWTGADISDNQILYAEKLSKNVGMDIDYIVAAAEDVDFPDRTFDVITACQCFMYFDKSVVLPKFHHILKDNGHLAILFMAWLPEESEIAKTSEDFVLKYNPAWTGGRMTRYELQEPPWCAGMFKATNMLTYDLPVHFTRESWHGRMKACRGIGASGLKESEIQKWEQEHWEYMQSLSEEFDILHYVSILDLEKI